MIRIITRVLLWKSRQWRHLWSNGPEPGWVGETRSETRPTQSSAAESSRSEYLKPVCTLGTLILPLDFKKHSSRGKWWTILYCRYKIVFFFRQIHSVFLELCDLQFLKQMVPLGNRIEKLYILYVWYVIRQKNPFLTYLSENPLLCSLYLFQKINIFIKGLHFQAAFFNIVLLRYYS